MDIFDTGVLAATVEQIVPEYGFLTREFFPGSQVQTATTIHIDVMKKSRRIAPFVSPYVQGQLVEKQGFQTFEISPAYIKDKRVFDPNTPFTRTYGEQIMGSLSPMERLKLSLRTELEDQLAMLNRRIEVMVGEVLFRGKLTIKGELHPLIELNFQRDAALTISLTGANEWGDAGIDPIANLQSWALLVFDKSGIRPNRVVMTLDAYQLFMASASVVAWMNRYNRDGATVTPNAVEGDDGWFAGSIGGFEIFVYNGTYIDPIPNTPADILPPMTVLLGGKSIKGYRAYGAIRDEKAGLQARPYFSKSWIEEDPPVRYIMLQSAPIVAPLYPDAMLAATVKVVS
jgi:hypothetical protein